MHGSPLVEWLLVVLSAATGAYGLHRSLAGAAGERRAARGDALMGLGMASMAVPAVAPAWAFAGAGLYAAGLFPLPRTGTGTSAGWAGHLDRAAGAFAMLYMAVAMADGRHHHPAGTPLLTGLLLVYFAGYVVRSAAALVPDRPPTARRELTHACRISMGTGMLTMLLMM